MGADAVRREVAEASWYHTIELPGGIVTEGEYDLRPVMEKLPFPASLAGRRCLDVGTRDGFYAFEMERRGAAEVVAIDLADVARLDWPEPRPQFPQEVEADLHARSRTFDVAHRALQSKVRWRDLSVYDLDPAEHGEFDFVNLGTLLLHLRDPVGALMAVARVLRGHLLLTEPISLSLSLLRRGPTAALMTLPDAPFWWIPNAKALRRYVEAAGLRVERQSRPFLVPNGPRRTELIERTQARRRLLLRAGSPHVWILAAPR